MVRRTRFGRPGQAAGKRPHSSGREREAKALQIAKPPRGAPGSAARQSRGGIAEGIVSANRAGYGFVRVEGMTDSIFLPPGEMRGLMHGDRVRVTVERGSDGRFSGHVLAVVERGVTAFLATVDVHGSKAWVIAADRRLQLRAAIAASDLQGARNGDWVIARITRHAGPGAIAEARIVRRLDPDRPVELAIETALARFELPVEFPEEVLREARAYGAAVAPQEADSRIDLRALPLVTIDGADAKDFDDAVYAEACDGGFRLLVAIADVSHYVRPGMALDASALARGTSVYFPNRVVPMLPHELSDHLCSLAPRVDRLCFVADMQVSRQGALRAAKFYPAVMRSAARLTYTQAYDALFLGRPEARRELGALSERLAPLVQVYQALHKARLRRGALDFDAAEARFDIDSNDRVRGIELYSRNDAHRLIEECMILANVAVAKELSRTRTPTLYRVHAQPDETKLDKLLATLTALGIEAQIPKTIAPRELQAITRRLGSAAERPFVESLIVRSLPQALYQPANIGHFGLALEHYAHFTSPIRRYPDLVVHRTLRALHAAGTAGAQRYEPARLEVLGEQTSRLEKRADEADRYVSTFLKCSYLRERIGQSFDGLISTVVEFGCFVQLLEVGIDGLLHTQNLRDDDYEMERDGHGWIGRRTHRRLRTGSRIRVMVTSVNPIEGLIDLELLDDEET